MPHYELQSRLWVALAREAAATTAEEHHRAVCDLRGICNEILNVCPVRGAVAIRATFAAWRQEENGATRRTLAPDETFSVI